MSRFIQNLNKVLDNYGYYVYIIKQVKMIIIREDLNTALS